MNQKYKEEMDEFLCSVMSPEWKCRHPHSKAVRLSVWCLVYYGATLDQLTRLSPNDRPNPVTERIYMNRQIQKGNWRIVSLVSSAHTRQVVYVPTKEWMKEAKAKLELLCEQEKKKGYPYLSPDTISYYYKRFLRKNDYQGLLHQICARDIGTTLVSCCKDYTYCTEVGIGLNGQILPFQTQKSLVDRTSTLLVSDGYGTFKDFSGQHAYTIHVEQDMIQQHSNVIKDKISNYCEYVFANTTDLAQLILAFSVYVPSSPGSRALPKRNGYGRTAKRYFSLYQFAAYCAGKNDMTLTELSDIMESYLEKFPEQYVRNALSMIYELQKIAPNLTIPELGAYLSSGNAVMEQQIQDVASRIRNQKFRNRKESIFMAALGEEKLKKYLLKGLSLYCIPNHDPSLREASFFGVEDIQKITAILFQKELISEPVPAFSPYDNGERLTLRNHLSYGDINVYVENISYDLGARIRVQGYLQEGRWHKKGILLCIYDREDTVAISMYENSPYRSNPKGPLTVLLLPEDSLKNSMGEFLNLP